MAALLDSRTGAKSNPMESNTQALEKSRGEEEEEQRILQFLDSIDSYLSLFDSLSSSLRQGWLELATARHSMGTSRINSVLLDLKTHSAATTLQVDEAHDESTLADHVVNQPHFTLSKWASLDDGRCYSREVEADEDMKKKSYSPQLRRRGGPTHFSDDQEKLPQTDETPLSVDDQVRKERAKLLSVFGTLVSPKLRTAQVSFETALETLVEIANTRSLMLSAYNQIKRDMEGIK